MSTLDPNSFGDALTVARFGPPVPHNAPAMPDQYGNPYVSLPVHFVHNNSQPDSNPVIAANRMAAQAASELSWWEKLKAWSHATDQRLIDTYAPMSKFSSANPEKIVTIHSPSSRVGAAASRAKGAITSAMWKLAFVVVLMFIGYFFIKAYAAKQGAALAAT